MLFLSRKDFFQFVFTDLITNFLNFSIKTVAEIVLLVSGKSEASRWDQEAVISALKNHINEEGVKRASASVARLSGWPKRDVYKLALTLKD